MDDHGNSSPVFIDAAFAGPQRSVAELVFPNRKLLQVSRTIAKVGGIVLLLAGGLCYSLGVIFYIWRRMAYHHAVWHLFVLAGSVLHFFSVFFYVVPAAGGPI